jgi:DNA-binding HxlR family transcriptional regulator
MDALGALCDRWTLLVVREALIGSRRFGGMQRNLDISRSLLSDRLRKLVGLGVLERRPYRRDPDWYEYHLTPIGLELWPAVGALTDWAARHVDHTEEGDRAVRERVAALAAEGQLDQMPPPLGR